MKMQAKNNKEMKQKIIDFFNGSESTASEISGSLGINYYKAVRILKELIKEEKIEIFEFRDKKYYRIMRNCYKTKEFSDKSAICKNCSSNKKCKENKKCFK